jgi:hypothetical protein
LLGLLYPFARLFSQVFLVEEFFAFTLAFTFIFAFAFAFIYTYTYTYMYAFTPPGARKDVTPVN